MKGRIGFRIKYKREIIGLMHFGNKLCCECNMCVSEFLFVGWTERWIQLCVCEIDLLNLFPLCNLSFFALFLSFGCNMNSDMVGLV